MTKLTRAQELACDAYDLIKHNPGTWLQSAWRTPQEACPATSEGEKQRTRCGTQLCWGGHLVVLAGGKFVTDDADSAYFDRLLAESFDKPYAVESLHTGDFDLKTVPVHERLSALLGLSVNELTLITSGYNTVSQIRSAIKKRLGVNPETRTLVTGFLTNYDTTMDNYHSVRCPCGDPYCGPGSGY